MVQSPPWLFFSLRKWARRWPRERKFSLIKFVDRGALEYRAFMTDNENFLLTREITKPPWRRNTQLTQFIVVLVRQYVEHTIMTRGERKGHSFRRKICVSYEGRPCCDYFNERGEGDRPDSGNRKVLAKFTTSATIIGLPRFLFFSSLGRPNQLGNGWYSRSGSYFMLFYLFLLLIRPFCQWNDSILVLKMGQIFFSTKILTATPTNIP